MSERRNIIQSSRDVLSGMPVFAKTRVPVKNLFDSLKEGGTLDAFLEASPKVSREQAMGVLDLAWEALLAEESPKRLDPAPADRDVPDLA